MTPPIINNLYKPLIYNYLLEDRQNSNFLLTSIDAGLAKKSGQAGKQWEKQNIYEK